MGSRSSLPSGCIFLLAWSLREKCNLISQIGGPAELTCSAKTSAKNCKTYILRTIIIWYRYITYIIYPDSSHMHWNTCANLAPSLCFEWFPCVTPHNKIEKSYKCVGCDTPRPKFEYRTVERLSHVNLVKTCQKTKHKRLGHWKQKARGKNAIVRY